MKRVKTFSWMTAVSALWLFAFSCAEQDKNTDPLSPQTPSHSAGETRTDGKGIQQVWVPAGSFLMGTSETEARDVVASNPPTWVLAELPSEQPRHEVRLTIGFWMDKTEVTHAAFQAFTADSGYYKIQYWSEDGQQWLNGKTKSKLPYSSGKELPDHPRVQITWYEAEAYARWRGGRLPTEAEWEFAARGPSSSIYPWGNTFDNLKANLVGSKGLKPVGSYQDGLSWVGALDMAGNAMEWVRDWLDVNYYKQNVHDDPTSPATGTIKIEKGGWWGSNSAVARSAYRHFEDPPTYGDGHIGFRIVTMD